MLIAAPFPPRLDGMHGGSRALAQLLTRLGRRHSVALLVLRTPDEPGVGVLRRSCEVVDEVEIEPAGSRLPARLRDRVRRWTSLLRGTPTWAAERSAPGFEGRLERLVREFRPDVVQLEYRIMGQFAPAVAGSAPCLLVEYDPAAFQDGGRSLRARLEARAWGSLGRAAFSRVDSIVVLTERDREVVSRSSGSTPIVRIPLAYSISEPPLDPAGTDPYGIVSVGSFIHPPNIDAALWLAREIFPSVRARVPGASLRLVGSHVVGEVRALDENGVSVIEDVPDVRPYLDAAAVVVAPIRTGGGMRVKVMEALAAGKALVATSLALEGLDLEDGAEVIVAETSAEFADALVGLLGEQWRARRTAIATAARRWAEEHLDPEAQVDAYEALYSSISGAPREAPGTARRSS